MTNVVSLFKKTKINDADGQREQAVQVIAHYLRPTLSTEDRPETEVDATVSENEAGDDEKTRTRFKDIEQANAERLKRLEEERKKNNQMVLKSYRIK